MSLIAQDIYDVIGQETMSTFGIKVSYLGLLAHVPSGGDLFAEPNFDGSWQLTFTDEHAQQFSCSYPDPIKLLRTNENFVQYKDLPEEEIIIKASALLWADLLLILADVNTKKKNNEPITDLISSAPAYCKESQEKYQED